ncbi:hypothetical protein [Methanosphaera sp.]
MDIRTIEVIPKQLDIDIIIQHCECTYHGKTVEFKVTRDENGLYDDILFLTPDGELDFDYSGEDINDPDIQLILGAIDQGEYIQPLRAEAVGMTFPMNHESIKPNPYDMHFPAPYYLDEEGEIIVSLIRNEIVTNN